jgi:S1-C subfamily serine protease
MRILLLALLPVSIHAAEVQDPAEDEVRRSVVKIFATMQKPDYYQPWQTDPQDNVSGSGVIIKGRRILTNAHVVSDQTYIDVRKVGDSARYRARVEFVAHDAEVALLSVDDPAFFDGTQPVEFGGLPRQRDRLAAYGFPMGGDELSITEGVVSRIEVIEYTHSARMLLAIQTDAAINPGNSGGPVVKAGRLAGISFQVVRGDGAESIGYVVPMPMIRRFLTDIADGRYDGVPRLGVVTQATQNPDLRRYFKVPPPHEGELVKKVVYGSSAWGVLKEGDVITAIDGTRIAQDGTVLAEDGKRLSWVHLVNMHQAGSEAGVDVIRGGKLQRLRLRLGVFDEVVAGPYYDVKPSYFVHAGLVFTPLTRNYMTLWEDVATSFRMTQEFLVPSPERQQAVLLAYVLPHEVNAGYHEFRGILIDSVNGVRVGDMRDLVRAFEKPQDGFHVIRTDDLTDFGGNIILDAARAAAAHPEILARHGIVSDRSADLR